MPRVKKIKEKKIKLGPHNLDTYRSLINELIVVSPETNWGSEISMAKTLLKGYPLNFLLQQKKPKITSLRFYVWMANNGKYEDEYRQFASKLKIIEFSDKKSYHLQDQKVGEDAPIENKILTVKDFIKF